MKTLEILLWKLAIRRIRSQYGGKCTTYQKGCLECWAKETIGFIEHNIYLIKDEEPMQVGSGWITPEDSNQL